MQGNKIAVIDLGTTSTKILISEYKNKSFQEVFRKKYESNLGDGLHESKIISREAVNKNLQILLQINNLLKEYNVGKAKIFSTEVLRSAQNSNEVVSQIEQGSGLPVRVLTHDEESFAFWNGLTSDLECSGLIAGYDVGGGSYQFMYGTKKELHGVKLVKKGVNYYLNNFTPNDPPLPQDFDRIEEDVAHDIQDLTICLGKETPFIHGSSSVLDFYKEAGYVMTPYKYSLSHPYQLDLSETKRMYYKVRCLPYEERQKYFPSLPFFMKGTYVGTAIFLKLAEKTGITFELPSNNNIANGLIYLLAEGLL